MYVGRFERWHSELQIDNENPVRKDNNEKGRRW